MDAQTKKRPPNTTRGILLHCLPYIRGNTLDVGAGNAKYKEIILRHASSYVTMDMVNGPQIDVVGDVHALPFEQESFDTAICTQVLEHVKEPWIVFEQIAKVLRPGGCCIVTAPFMVPFHSDPHDYYRYTTMGMRHLCTRAGLTVQKEAVYGGLMAIIAESMRFILCDPYNKKQYGILRRNVINYLHKLLLKIDWIHPPNTYSNVLLIAKKEI